jgi:mannose-6-phosphate isomerase-like protein (cupin superfamily)
MAVDDTTPSETRAQPNRFAIFTYQDAPMFWETDMLSELGGSDDARARYEEAWEAGHSRASLTKVLYRQDQPDGVSLIHAWQKPGKVMLRHSHDSDCLYYLVAGSIHLGNRTLGPGDGFFVPAGHPYGFVAGSEGAELLEIRPGATSFDLQVRDQSPEKWDEFVEAVRTHPTGWEGDDVPISRRRSVSDD